MTDPYDYQHGEYITGNDGNYEIVQYQSNNHGDINSNIFKYIVTTSFFIFIIRLSCHYFNIASHRIVNLKNVKNTIHLLNSSFILK